MSISIVNGYVCTSCSDVAKAKKGENPADSKEAPGGTTDRRDRSSGFDPSAVVFGGSLATTGIAPPVTAAASDIGSRLDQRA
ncbi:hypothetical protein [uncultured Alsobacter sp.]|uniref:hypothetical protein n=1 Tax=uncultured Alsobacter sp. TaxID=1748258 RepID=UPI0025DA2F2C|nr:hypothetical protein [uncultured Alsobacter sp.]